MGKDLIMKEACFVCSSPYQIMNAIAIEKNNRFDADLYIICTFPGCDRLATRIHQYSIFSNIYVVNPEHIGTRGPWAKVNRTLFARKTVSRFLLENIFYKSFFFSCRSSLKNAMLKELLQRNSNMHCTVFEDGMGTYSDRCSSLAVSPARRYYEKVFRLNLIDPRKTSFMVYLPELVHYLPPFDVCKIEPIKRLEINEKNKKMLFDLFSVPQEGAIHEKCIIFDFKRDDNTFLSPEQTGLLDRCYKSVTNQMGNMNVILKPHPRSQVTDSNEMKKYSYKGIPMEVLYADMMDIQDRILVSFASTAVFTPKIFYGVEPTVICLHHIVKDNRISQNFEGIYKKFKSIYNDPEKVFAPNSIEELEIRLKQIMV